LDSSKITRIQAEEKPACVLLTHLSRNTYDIEINGKISEWLFFFLINEICCYELEGIHTSMGQILD